MPNVHITIKNLPQIRAAFRAAPQLMGKNFGDAIKKSTFLVEGKSKIGTPVKTGYLRASHRTHFEGLGLRQSGIVEPTANYSIFVHEGTRFMQGRPFLRQALESSESTIQDYFRKATQDALDSIARRV